MIWSHSPILIPFKRVFIGKDYEVHGVIRYSSVDYCKRIAYLEGSPKFYLHYMEMTDFMSFVELIVK